jgi:hypothetical protein
MTITQSTISGNTTDKGYVAGILTRAATVYIDSSTIVDNLAGSAPSPGTGPGLVLASPLTVDTTLRASLLSGNVGDTVEQDLAVYYEAKFSADSTYNLIRQTDYKGIPGDTITGVCPLLGPLRDNGGPTWTRALLSESPGIDKGANILMFGEDQRGTKNDPMPLPYPRESNGTADIGAYEVNQADIVFNAGFDGCPAIP